MSPRATVVMVGNNRGCRHVLLIRRYHVILGVLFYFNLAMHFSVLLSNLYIWWVVICAGGFMCSAATIELNPNTYLLWCPSILVGYHMVRITQKGHSAYNNVPCNLQRIREMRCAYAFPLSLIIHA